MSVRLCVGQHRAGHQVLMLLALSLLVAACVHQEPTGKPATVRPVKAMRVFDESALTERRFPGRASAEQEVNLSFRVTGPLITFPVDVGHEVKKGDVVARIDPTDYEAALRTVQGRVDQEQARAKRAKQDLDRLERIFRQDPGATSEAAIDRARQLRDSSAAGVRSLQGSVKTVRDQLSYTYLKAPFDGTVSETYVENFETVLIRQPILRLLNPSSIEFIIDIPESLIGYTPYVETVTVRFDALPGRDIPAKIKKIGKEASQATRTYPVTLVMEQPDDAEILPGMAGSASVKSRLPEESKLAGMEIPATSVFSADDPNKSYVWVVDEASKTLSRREIEIGMLSNFGVLVKAGLKPGEWILVAGVHSVKEGQQVRIIDASAADGAS